jgi:hypothetical protein
MKNPENIPNIPLEDEEEKGESMIADDLEQQENVTEQSIEAQRFVDEEKGFMENLSGKAKTVARVMVLCTALASVGWSNAEASDTVKKYKYTQEELQQRSDAGKYSKDERIHRILQKELKRAREKRNKTEEYIDRAFELADKMGIVFDPDNVEIKVEGFVPTIINGKDVPVDMFTEKERQNIERARKISQSLEGSDSENKNRNKNGNRKKIRSNVTQSNDYMNLSDF